MSKIYAPASKPQEMFLNTPDWVDICFYGGQAGGGKRVSLDTPVLTNAGWVKAGDVTYNHKLVAVDGTYTNVVGIYPAKDRPTYKLEFSDGQEILADDEHLWEVKSSKHGARDGWVVRTTKELFDSKSKWSIPLIESPVLGNQWTGCDPYILGYILGDGTLTGKYTTIYTVDGDTIDYLSTRGWKVYNYEALNTTMCQYLKEDFRNVLGKVSGDNKCIPEELLLSDPNTRLELLRGLMDSDGTIYKDGSAKFITTNENLRDGVIYLVRSLGGRSSYRKVFKETDRGGRGWYYIVKVSYGTSFNPFKMKRKADRVVNQRLRNMEITNISRVENTDGVCFTVSHPRHLFIIDGFVVTHNTFAGLMHHLKYAHDPLYRGLTLRRTTPMLLKPGAVWDEAKQLYKDIDPDGKIKLKDLKYVCTSGAEIAFSHFERVDDTDNFQGAQISSCVMEELCQFEESQFSYILSRLRTKAKMKPNMRATMNPDPDSWVRKWVDWYLYPPEHELHGRPDPAKQGIIRWFIRIDNELVWADSKEKLLEDYPKSTPLSFRFISASVYDNPYIEPSYIAFLEGLPKVEREILLYGNWDARPEGASFFKRQWCDEVNYVDESQVLYTVRAWDMAATLKNPVNNSPDYTATARMRKMKDGTYIVDDVRRTRIRVGGWENFVVECGADDPYGTVNIIPQDPGSAGERATKEFCRRLSERGVHTKKERTNRSKLDRFRPFASMAENEGIKFLANCGTDYENDIHDDLEFVYKELEAFTGERKRGEAGHDDKQTMSSINWLNSVETSAETIPSEALYSIQGTCRDYYVDSSESKRPAH